MSYTDSVSASKPPFSTPPLGKGSCATYSVAVDDERPTLMERIGAHLGLLGVLVLIAWFALLWFMFGDVL